MKDPFYTLIKYKFENMYKTGSEFKDKMWLLRVDGQDVVIEHRGLMRGGIHKSCSTSLLLYSDSLLYSP
jgi:hypothetical protein